MKIKDIDRFFTELSKRINFSVRVYLLGGAASVLQGVSRVTYDIDFEVKLTKGTPKGWSDFQEAARLAGSACGIMPQYSEDVSRWSAIAMPEHRKKARLYKKYGSISVYILDPLQWAIGKLARYLESDISDLVTVLKSQKVPPKEAFQAWGRALGESPPSSAQPLFKKQVINFLHEKGKFVWGNKINLKEFEEIFLDSARRAAEDKFTDAEWAKLERLAEEKGKSYKTAKAAKYYIKKLRSI